MITLQQTLRENPNYTVLKKIHPALLRIKEELAHQHYLHLFVDELVHSDLKVFLEDIHKTRKIVAALYHVHKEYEKITEIVFGKALQIVDLEEEPQFIIMLEKAKEPPIYLRYHHLETLKDAKKVKIENRILYFKHTRERNWRYFARNQPCFVYLPDVKMAIFN